MGEEYEDFTNKGGEKAPMGKNKGKKVSTSEMNLGNWRGIVAYRRKMTPLLPMGRQRPPGKTEVWGSEGKIADKEYPPGIRAVNRNGKKRKRTNQSLLIKQGGGFHQEDSHRHGRWRTKGTTCPFEMLTDPPGQSVSGDLVHRKEDGKELSSERGRCKSLWRCEEGHVL